MRRVLWVVLAAVLAVTLWGAAASATTSNGSKPSQSGSRTVKSWVGTWAASPQPPYSSGISHDGFYNQTVRNIVHTSIGGTLVRVRLSNTFGNKSLEIGRASVAIQARGAAVKPDSVRTLTFDGKKHVVIPQGKQIFSDPVRLKIKPQQNLAVSIYVPNKSGPTTFHQDAQQVNYISTPGDHTSDALPTAFSGAASSWFYVDGVDVYKRHSSGAIVALGDSITDGYQSSINTNHRWPDYLSRRLDRLPTWHRESVLNEGISGNRVLRNSPLFGVSALKRLNRDVLSQSGVRYVIVLEGINDIQQTPHTLDASKIISGYKKIIRRAHAQGLKVYGGTLLPFEGCGQYYSGCYSKKQEQTREKVNHWICHSGRFDAVIDFDRAVRDPQNPKRLAPRYDSGDHLHPNDLGYKAMAKAIRLKLFEQKPNNHRTGYLREKSTNTGRAEGR